MMPEYEEPLTIELILQAIDDLPMRFGHPMWDTEFGRSQLRQIAVTGAVEGFPLDQLLPMIVEVVQGTSTQFPE